MLTGDIDDIPTGNHFCFTVETETYAPLASFHKFKHLEIPMSARLISAKHVIEDNYSSGRHR